MNLAELRKKSQFANTEFKHSCAMCSLRSCSELEERAEWNAARTALDLLDIIDNMKKTLEWYAEASFTGDIWIDGKQSDGRVLNHHAAAMIESLDE